MYCKIKINVNEELCLSTSAKDGGEWQPHVPAAFLVEKEHAMPTE
jgi:hypothetical protein